MHPKTRFGVCLKISHNPLDLVRQEAIVGVEQGNNLTPAGRKRCIEARCLSSIRLADQLHARVFSLIFLNDADRVIGRTVVTDDQFKVGIRLVKRALNRFADVAGVVVVRNENGNKRLRR